jgi:hypothetical protein
MGTVLHVVEGAKWIGKKPIKRHLLTKPRAEECKYLY